MNKEWVEKKIQEQEEKRQKLFARIRSVLTESELFSDTDVGYLLKKMEKDCRRPYGFGVSLDAYYVVGFAAQMHSEEERGTKAYYDKTVAVKNSMEAIITELRYTMDNYGRYLDSEPMEFDGDIIITDPCYFTKDDDWGRDGFYGSHLERLGIQHYITRDTLYGDWSCTVFDANTKEPIGKFCADAGLVTVASLDEVLKYNPAFDYHIQRPWTATLIRDFRGTAQIIVEQEKYTDDDDIGYTDFGVKVIGHGVNRVTGEPINFISAQTGL